MRSKRQTVVAPAEQFGPRQLLLTLIGHEYEPKGSQFEQYRKLAVTNSGMNFRKAAVALGQLRMYIENSTRLNMTKHKEKNVEQAQT